MNIIIKNINKIKIKMLNSKNLLVICFSYNNVSHLMGRFLLLAGRSFSNFRIP